MRLSSHMVMYISISMKMWPTDKPLKILRLYRPVRTIVSMDCMHTFSRQTNVHMFCRQYQCDAQFQLEHLSMQPSMQNQRQHRLCRLQAQKCHQPFAAQR